MLEKAKNLVPLMKDPKTIGLVVGAVVAATVVYGIVHNMDLESEDPETEQPFEEPTPETE